MFKSIRKHLPDSHPVLDVLTVVVKAISRSMARDVMLFAGGASYFGLLAIFPAMAMILSVYGLANDISDVEAQIARFAGIMPPGAQDFVLNQMARLAVTPIVSLSAQGAVALMVALFAASRGAKALIAGLNHLAEDQDIRNVLHFNILAMSSVLTVGLMLALANLVVLAVPVLLRKIFVGLGLEPVNFDGLVNEWTAATMVMALALALLYRMTMRRRSEAVSWRASLIAAIVSTALWLVLSKSFSLYVGQVIDFGIYGSLGALVVFLLWIYWSAYAVFFGGALAIEIDARYGPRGKAGRA